MPWEGSMAFKLFQKTSSGTKGFQRSKRSHGPQMAKKISKSLKGLHRISNDFPNAQKAHCANTSNDFNGLPVVFLEGLCKVWQDCQKTWSNCFQWKTEFQMFWNGSTFIQKLPMVFRGFFGFPCFHFQKKWMEGLEWSSFRSERLQGICAFQKLPSGIWIFHRVSNCPSRFEAISRCLSDRQDAEAASAGTKRLQMALTGSEGKHAQWPQPIPRNFER